VRQASLPMYNLSEMAVVNEAFWSALRKKLLSKGLSIGDVEFDIGRPPVPDTFGEEVYITQLCGYPFMTRFADQGSLLGSPSYAFPGCVGATHVAYFLVRDSDPATSLQDMRGRIFGCNSLLSNSGMNLARLAIARIAEGRPFFSAVRMTGGHNASLDRLADGSIDVCSIDCVTWGFFQKFRREKAARFRVLGETPRSPTLPFVTSAATPSRDRQALADALREFTADPATADVRDSLNLTDIVDVDISVYARVLDYELEAAKLGYAAIH
jgi:ABC-type phosphate/phosphonate transport system substrate-binding protein